MDYLIFFCPHICYYSNKTRINFFLYFFAVIGTNFLSFILLDSINGVAGKSYVYMTDKYNGNWCNNLMG